MDRRRWRAVWRQLDRLVAELVCLAPVVLVPDAPSEPEATTGNGLNQPLGRPRAPVSITNPRPVVVAGAD